MYSFINIPTIIVLSETWLTTGDDNCLFDLPEYNIFRKDRLTGIRGGLVIGVRQLNSLFVREILIPNCNSECLAIEISTPFSKFALAAVYKPPTASLCYLDNLLLCLNFLISAFNDVLIIGDFNFPHINWNLYHASNNVGGQQLFVNFVNDNGLSQFVHLPTRGGNILDLCLSTHQYFVSDIKIEPPLCATNDHFPIYGKLSVNLQNSTDYREIYDFAHADYNAINNYLLQVPWDALFEPFANIANVNPYWEAFSSIVDNAVKLFVPKKRVPLSVNNKRKLFLSNCSKQLIIRKRLAWKTYISNGHLPIHKAKFKSISNRCSKSVRQDKKRSEERILSSKSNKCFYNYVKSQLHTNESIPVLSSPDGSIYTSDIDKANCLNRFFSSVYTTSDNITPNFISRVPNNVNLDSVIFSECKVSNAINRLKSNSPGGPDGLPSTFFKGCSLSLCAPLAKLFNISMATGTVPSIWLKANVIPVFKGKGSKSNPEGYRPISLTCISCKLMERIICESIICYLTKHKLISNDQHGFLRKRSTATQLIRVVKYYVEALDSGKSVDVIFLDLRKAFDSVCHDKLLTKLQGYGFSDNLIIWISAFLGNRFARVKCGNSFSDYLPVISGVPQGSILGPILFLLYINDLSDVIQFCNLGLFADDSKLYKVVNNDLDYNLFQSDLNNISDWLRKWQLSVNEDKCQHLHVGRANLNYTFFLNRVAINRADIVRDLGILFTSNLKWGQHISHIISQANRKLSLIFKAFINRDRSFLIKMFTVYVRPLLEYCTVVFSPRKRSSVDIVRIEAVQRRFTRNFNDLSHLSYNERLSALGLKSLERRRLEFDLCFLHKIIHNHIDVEFSSLFQFNSANLRGNALKLNCTSKFRTDLKKYFFSSHIVHVWNYLTNEVVLLQSTNSFKNAISSINLDKFLSTYRTN